MTRESQPRSCSIQGCSGAYESQRVVHTVRHRGKIVVIENVPAEVCSVCGDVLFTPETMKRIEEIVDDRSHRAVGQAPVYQFA